MFSFSFFNAKLGFEPHHQCIAFIEELSLQFYAFKALLIWIFFIRYFLLD